MKQPNKTHVFITMENLVKIFPYRNTPIKVNKSWYEDQLEAIKEAGIETEIQTAVLVDETMDKGNLDSKEIPEESLGKAPQPKPSGAVSFTFGDKKE